MRVETVTASTALPVDLEDVKLHLRIETGETSEDEYIRRLVLAAQNQVEEDCCRALTRRTLRVYYDDWPESEFTLPYPPLSTATTPVIRYKDTDSSSITLGTTVYKCDAVSEPARILADYDEDWPSITLHNVNPISIQYVCGYNGSANVPARLKQAVMVLVSDMYENREPTVVAHSFERLPVYNNLIKDYRDFNF